MRRTYRAALLAATLLSAGGGLALAQTATPAATPPAQAAVYDATQLPTTQGKVAQYDVTPRGDVDGLILDDGTEVHFPPHLGVQVVAAVRPGDSVTIHGLKARAMKLVQAMSIANDSGGATIDLGMDGGPGFGPGPRPPHGPGADRGPEHGPGRHMGTPIEAQGTVKMALHGPRGEMNGVLLNDGTMIHLPPTEATRMATQLQPGASFAARGEGVANNLGKSLAAFEAGPSLDKLVRIAPPPHGPRHAPPGDAGPDRAPPPPAPGGTPN